MSNLSLRLPDSLHAKIRELAAKDDVSINQFIATAVAEKAAALLTLAYLEERAKRADPAAFDRILARVADVPPSPEDEIQVGTVERGRRSGPGRRRGRNPRPGLRGKPIAAAGEGSGSGRTPFVAVTPRVTGPAGAVRRRDQPDHVFHPGLHHCRTEIADHRLVAGPAGRTHARRFA